MPRVLVKHPLEARVYTFDFSTSAGSGGRRGTVWAQDLLDSYLSEIILAGPMLPLLGSMTQVQSPLFLAERVDGQESDLGITLVGWSTTQVQAMIQGGTDGMRYTITCEVATSGNGRLVSEGWLLVTGDVA